MIGTFRRLRKLNLLGINDRNINFISAHNPRRLHRLVNDKVITKRLAHDAKIPAPELYGSIRTMMDLRELETLLLPLHGFVVKPASGSQGNGILVIERKVANGWQLASGRRITPGDIRFHVSNILSGMFSLGGQQDTAMIEYRVEVDPLFDNLSFKGVPDIRVIVIYGVPAAAMVRLPTAESDGKANLHKGGIGVGIDIATGITGAGVQHDRPIDHHPDTGASISGITIPGWDDILKLASRSYDMTRLGYLGVDVVLDRDHGPMLLELNARPGIAIQIAVRTGLSAHFRKVLQNRTPEMTIDERLAFARQAYQENVVGAG